MSDKMRRYYGDTNPVVVAVDAETVIEIGDLVWQDVDDAKPASRVPTIVDDGLVEGVRLTASSLQECFADKFLGVAMQRSRGPRGPSEGGHKPTCNYIVSDERLACNCRYNGDTTPIRVATTDVFEFDCMSNRFELGDLIGVRCIATIRLGDSETPERNIQELANQEVTKVNESRYAIGRVAKREPASTTEVLVDIWSTVMTGGVLTR